MLLRCLPAPPSWSASLRACCSPRRWWAWAAPARTAGQARVGGRPRTANGKTYADEGLARYREEGVTSWYGAAHHGKKTANGERFDAHGAHTAAHKTLPFNVCAEVENLRTGKSVLVRINDRGPFAKGRVIDLSKAAASEIGLVKSGVAKVRVEAVGVASAQGECRRT
jgi:rare lipoprotein A